MLPELAEEVAVPPALGHGPVSGLKVAGYPRPLAGDGVALILVLGGSGLGGRGRRGCLGRGLSARGEGGRIFGVLRGPVVDVPVLFEEELVVFLELGAVHLGEVVGGEGGEEEVGFEGSAVAGLVCGMLASPFRGCFLFLKGSRCTD